MNCTKVRMVELNMNMIMDYVGFWQDKYSTIFVYAYEHLILSVTALLFAMVLTIPLAIFMTKLKSNGLKNFFFNLANVFQTIPTIALFAILVPFLGIGFKPAVLALFLYALLPLLRNTYAGVMSIDPDTIEAAKGMGFNTFQRIIKVELPVALPYIMSGVRVTTIYIISWTTLAAIVGAGGLGGLILSGIGFNDKFMIFTGTVIAISLALIIDLLFSRVEKNLSRA